MTAYKEPKPTRHEFETEFIDNADQSHTMQIEYSMYGAWGVNNVCDIKVKAPASMIYAKSDVDWEVRRTIEEDVKRISSLYGHEVSFECEIEIITI